MSIDDKRTLLVASRPFINRYIFDRTLAIVAHDGKRPLENGSGMLLGLEEGVVIISAAHVVKGWKEHDLQLVANERPSNVKAAPNRIEYVGGGEFQELDLAYLQLSPESTAAVAEKKLLRLEDLDVFPTELDDDLAICFGMPVAERNVDGRFIYCYNSFSYLTGISAEFDWQQGDRPKSVHVEYPKEVNDSFTSRRAPLPAPYGMSGGGMWRVTFKGEEIWTLEQVRLIGVNTEFFEEQRAFRANRIEALLEFLGRDFPSAARYLEAERARVGVAAPEAYDPNAEE